MRCVHNQVPTDRKCAMKTLLTVTVATRWVYGPFFWVNWPVQCIKSGA
jgi:hypothetical protein